MKIVDIFCDRRESVILLYWQGMQKSLCAGFFEIRNNSRIILGSPWRRDQCFHPKHTGSKNPGNIIIWDNNFAIFIILLENVQKLSQSHLWFDTGFDFDNYRDYVDISKLSKELDYVKALPGICAYTGMNYLPAFCSIIFRLPIIDDKNAKICGWICGFG